MKVVILAGGFGTRLSEETYLKPKPMVEVGGMPLLWHIMKIYSHFGFTEFVICLGYKGSVIRDFFLNYYFNSSSITVDLASNSVEVHSSKSESWKVTLVDTGTNVETGGRVKRIAPFVEGDRSFCLTYGDGLADIDLKSVLEVHRSNGKIATVSAVRPQARFGALNIDRESNRVSGFTEKPIWESGWINGGFFVVDTSVFSYIDGDDTVFEAGPLERLASDDQLVAHKHEGFWWPVDTLRDLKHCEGLWKASRAPWKVW